MTITAALVESYRTSWFPSWHTMSAAERDRRATAFWWALRSPGLTASEHNEKAELFRRVVGTRPTELVSRTGSLQADIRRAVDGVLSRQRVTSVQRARAELKAALTAAERERSAHRSLADRALLASLDAAIVRAENREPRPARPRI